MFIWQTPVHKVHAADICIFEEHHGTVEMYLLSIKKSNNDELLNVACLGQVECAKRECPFSGLRIRHMCVVCRSLHVQYVCAWQITTCTV